MTTAALTTDTTRLAALISAKLQVLEILVRLSRRQLELIAAGDTPVLLKLLTAKETVLAQLQTVERQLDPFRNEDPEQRAWKSPVERAACQRDADRANALLAEAMQLERQAEAAMITRRDAAAAALSAAHIAADARTAYAAGPLSNPSGLHVEG
jgi:flagellar biosynthesis/type III secretory pathway chaperone